MPKKICIDAGREFDDVIATRIVGLKKARGIFTYWKMEPRWEFYRPDAHQHYLRGPESELLMVYDLGCDTLRDEPPPYSADVGWAFHVVEAMRKDGFSFKLFQPASLENVPGESTIYPVSASFICGRGPCERHGNERHNHHGAYDVEAETAPLAICRAALFARKVEL